MKNSADQLRRVLSIEAEGQGGSPQDLQNSSYPTKAKFNNCFIIHLKYFPVVEFCHFAICFSAHHK